jgi:hypothetical protein
MPVTVHEENARPLRRSSSLRNFAERHDISLRLAYDEIKAGRLKIKKVGRRSIVTDEDEARWLESLASPQAA